MKKKNIIKIGIDIDNTINSNDTTINFFSLITQLLADSAEIHIITNRETSEKSRKETIRELDSYGIHYDELKITSDKATYIKEKRINVFFDDTDENFVKLPSSVTVFKIREDGNFDFSAKKWVYGKKTGYNIEE